MRIDYLNGRCMLTRSYTFWPYERELPRIIAINGRPSLNIVGAGDMQREETIEQNEESNSQRILGF